MQAALRLQRGDGVGPRQVGLFGHVAQGEQHAVFHGREAADVDVGVGVGEQLRHIGSTLADQILHVALGLTRGAREGEVNVDEVLGQVLQRTEVGQFLLGPRAEEQHEFAAVELAAFTQAAAPFGHGAHRSAAGAGADHHDVALGVVGHQEAGSERADDLHRVAHLQVAHVVARHAAHGVALVVFQHALDGERHVVVASALAVARAGHGILPRMMRAALLVGARRDDADGLALQYREWHGAEVQHDVVGVVLLAHLGDAHVAYHLGNNELLRGLGAVEIGVGMGRGPRRQAGAEAGAAKHVVRFRCDGGSQGHGIDLRGRFGVGAFPVLRVERFGEHVPSELCVQRVGLVARHVTPVVDGAGGTGRHAGHAEIAFIRVNHIVVGVMGDGTDGAGGLAGVAADADFRVNQMLPQNGGGGHVHVGLQGEGRARAPRGCCLVEAHVLEVDGLAVDAHDRRRDPVGELTGVDHAAHQRNDEVAILVGRQPFLHPLVPLVVGDGVALRVHLHAR